MLPVAVPAAVGGWGGAVVWRPCRISPMSASTRLWWRTSRRDGSSEALASVVDLNGAYQADIEQGVVTIAGRPLRVVLLGTVSKATGTWLWSWANQGLRADAAGDRTRPQGCRDGRLGLRELGEPQFSLAGVLDTGLGAGASVALVAAPLVGATAFYSADYGAGIAYFGIVDPAVPRPAAQAVTFPRRTTWPPSTCSRATRAPRCSPAPRCTTCGSPATTAN